MHFQIFILPKNVKNFLKRRLRQLLGCLVPENLAALSRSLGPKPCKSNPEKWKMKSPRKAFEIYLGRPPACPFYTFDVIYSKETPVPPFIDKNIGDLYQQWRNLLLFCSFPGFGSFHFLTGIGGVRPRS